uniref:Uncharacterized protein n=1 Tax=Timema shepardi TaxID=629360 RepID=A0A7R9B281_TIMSH|nr:unnamed protein product [Timema shepardi]
MPDLLVSLTNAGQINTSRGDLASSCGRRSFVLFNVFLTHIIILVQFSTTRNNLPSTHAEASQLLNSVYSGLVKCGIYFRLSSKLSGGTAVFHVFWNSPEGPGDDSSTVMSTDRKGGGGGGVKEARERGRGKERSEEKKKMLSQPSKTEEEKKREET